MHKYTLENKIKKSFLSLILIIILLIMLVLITSSNYLYRKQSEDLCEQIVELNITLIDHKIQELLNLADAIAKDSHVIQALEYRNNSEIIDYNVELYNQRYIQEKFATFSNTKYIVNGYIVNTEGQPLYDYKKGIKKEYAFSKEAWFQEIAKDTSNAPIYFSKLHNQEYLLSDSQERYISMMVPIKKTVQMPGQEGFLILDLNLQDLLQHSSRQDNVKIILVKDFEPIYLGDQEKLSKQELALVNKVLEVKQETYISREDRSRNCEVLVINKQSKIFNWNILAVKPLEELQEIKENIILGTIVVLLLTVGVVIYISNRLAKSMLNPMNTMLEDFNRLAKGDFSVVFEESDSVEISILSDTASYMIQNMLLLSDELVEKQKKLAEEQLRVLQHQINPHFLNNVLQTIKSLSDEGQNQKIAALSTYLGKLFAYSVYQPFEEVSIQEELKCVAYYIQIQNIRYSNGIVYSITCEDAIKCNLLSKFLIQPIVENSIVYSIKEKQVLYLCIQVEQEEEEIAISISDNGIGIDENLLNELQKKINEKGTFSEENSIGLLNVHSRVQRRYGEHYGLKIVSRKGRGTTVIIRIPNQKRMEENVKGDDCR